MAIPFSAFADPKESAKLAHLSYQGDSTPGLSRTRRGRGEFVYATASGKVVKGSKDISRINALAIPPAWQDVWVSASSRSHIQATGIDKSGTKQYLYHTKWNELREQMKYERLHAFAEALPTLRKAIAKAVKEPELTKEKVAAAALLLIDETALRVGNDVYTDAHKTYGVTTLLDRHVSVEGDTIELSFIGKSHKEQEREFKNHTLAAFLKKERKLPGTRVFQYVDAEGKRHPLTSVEVNEFMHAAIGADFSAKDFRTWSASVYAYELLKEECERVIRERSEITEKSQAKALRTVISCVAQKLGNTVAVCKAHYIHAGLQEEFTAGTLAAHIAKARRTKPAGLKGIEAEFAALLGIFARAKAKK